MLEHMLIIAMGFSGLFMIGFAGFSKNFLTTTIIGAVLMLAYFYITEKNATDEFREKIVTVLEHDASDSDILKDKSQIDYLAKNMEKLFSPKEVGYIYARAREIESGNQVKQAQNEKTVKIKKDCPACDLVLKNYKE